MNYTNSAHNVSSEKFKRNVIDNADVYSTSPYSSSLPSPPYSEESYNGNDERDWNERVPPRLELTNETVRKLKGGCFNNEFGGSKSNSPNKLNYKKDVCNKRIPQHLVKVYPNLMKNVIGETDQKRKKRLKTNRGSPQKKKQVTCHVCLKNVTTHEMKHHLYFGPVKCLTCGWTEEFCPNFSSFHLSPKIGGGCQHSNLKWNTSPVDFLKKSLKCDGEEATQGTFRKKLDSYLQLLLPLKNFRPWSKAFDICDSFISSSSPQKTLTSCNNTSDESFVMLTKKGGKRQQPIETIDLPDGEFYLILKEAIEECPNCYEKLDPRNLRFSIETWLISTICGGCSLNVFFVLTPPDGSEPRITILHES